MRVHCKYDRLVKVKDLKRHPQNPNKHPKDQIERLAKILKYQGWRYPVKVSNQSGLVTSGHGRMDAAILNKWDKVPVSFQDYDDNDQELADLTSDNSIAEWAVLDFSQINEFVGELGPEFDIDLLGIRNFGVDVSDNEWDGMPEFIQEDAKGYKSVALHFQTKESVDEFAKLINQTITDKTKSIWYPKMEKNKLSDKRYGEP